jgi:DNA replication and repair protein RecF
MIFLKKLFLRNFRNLEEAEFSFSPKENWFIGPNGAGKTTALEAIAIVSTGKSHRTQNLLEAIQYGKPYFVIEAILSSHGIEEKIRIVIGPDLKEVWHNETRLPGLLSLLGLLPSVFYAPSDIALIERSPKERRRFLNIHLAQLSNSYLQELANYTKALAQRNALLRSKQTSTLSLWETLLAKATTALLEKRKTLLQNIEAKLHEEYVHLQKREEIPRITYEPSPNGEVSPLLWEKMRPREFAVGYTLLGSHRDDFTLLLNNKPAKTYASEGQKRSFIAAVKIAEANLFTSPLFLLDDFGVHLDPARQELLHNRIKTIGQLFLTAPTTRLASPEACLIQLA